jgi:hypothetical protein
MNFIRPIIVLAATIAFSLGLAVLPAVSAENSEPAKATPSNAVEIYKQGDDFVVAVYHPDGTAVLAVVEPAPVKHHSRKRARMPSIAELMKTGRVKYTIRVNPGESEAKSKVSTANMPVNVPSATGAAASKADLKLSPKEKARLRKKSRATARALQTASKALADHR